MNQPSISNSFDEIILRATIKEMNPNGKQPILCAASCAVNSLGADSGSIWLRTNDFLRRVVVVNRPIELLNSFTVKITEDEPMANAVRSLSPFRTNNIQSTNLKQVDITHKENLNAALFFPIHIKQACFGAFTLFKNNTDPFSDEDVEKIEFIANILALYINEYSINSGNADSWCSLFNFISASSLTPSDRKFTPQNANTVWLTYKDLPKGILPETLLRVESELQKLGTDISASDISSSLSISPSTVRRYLTFLFDNGVLSREAVYKKVGRPEYSYSIRNDAIIGFH